MNKLIIAAAALLVIASPAALTSAAHAEDANSVTSKVSVRYADLDVNHDTGAQALIYRIKAAAKLACGDAPDIRDMQARDDYKACVANAANQAADTVHAPLVASLGGRTSPMPESVASR